MLAPYHTIVELLGSFGLAADSEPGESTAYRWVELLSPEIGFDSKDTIYIAPHALPKDVKVPEGFFCVMAGDPAKAGVLVRAVKDYIEKLQGWEKAMMAYVIEKDLHGLLKASGAIIGNTLLVYNENFRLLTYYADNPDDDEYYSDLIKANTLSEHEKPDFAARSDPQMDTDSGFEKAAERVGGVFVARTLFVQDYPKGQICMLCDPDTATPGRIALFEIMLNWLQIFFDREAPNVESSKNIEAFLIDLVENRSTDPVSISNRADYCGIPTNKYYCLFVARFKDGFRDNEAKQLLKKLKKELPQARMLLYNGNIMMLNYYKEATNRDETEEWIAHISDALKEARAELGVSAPEESLAKLHLSYKRAIMAIEYGRRVHQRRMAKEGCLEDIDRYTGYDIYLYETYYVYHLIDVVNAENRATLESSLCMRALAKLYAVDCENKTDNLSLLYCYLINERSASKTAAVMHMHRNNVIYRMNRIERILGIDMREYHIRFKFLLSYRIIDYFGADFLKNVDYATFGTNMTKK
ncbi:MAG: helix-turn-helix domain-containing protein [Clostridiales bacterium]|nr:helix-turn-helix domain-containing protein [Clostridiales bacterium]